MNGGVIWSAVDPNYWSIREELREFTSAAELDQILLDLDPTFPEEAPVLVVVRRANGNTLAIGLGPALLYPDDEADL